MQLVANQQLVKNRVRLGLVFHFGAMAVLIGGAVLSTQLDPARQIAWQTWLAFVAGLGLYTLGQTQLRRWGPGKRQEESLGQAIRGLDDRYKLYAFLSSSLPDYILVSPAGVQVLITRTDGGQISCVRDKWKASGSRLMSLFGPGLGNPSADAARQLQKLRVLLEQQGFHDAPTSSVIVFTNPKVQLRVEGASSPITRIKELKDVLRRMAGRGTNVALTSSRIRDIQRMFDARMQAAHSWR
ncbi:MAG: hypothetical protein JO057_31365 [Chloroflexi bacterium]|nr:hypothetical protein [Chloroflexota bacterium]